MITEEAKLKLACQIQTLSWVWAVPNHVTEAVDRFNTTVGNVRQHRG